MRLTDTIRSTDDLHAQYRDSSNLSARAAIYRFGVGQGWSPARSFDEMLARIPQEANLLELGCGPGLVWKSNLHRSPSGWRVLLTDLMPGMVAEATSAVRNDPRVQVRQMDAHRLDVPDESMDAVVANYMLYHVEDRPRAFAEIRRVLKPGGFLFAATNSDAHLEHMRSLLDEFLAPEVPVELGKMLFSLENGGDQLRPYFSTVQIIPVNNELRIPDPEIVVQYVLSIGKAREVVQGERLQALRQRVQREIDQHGAFIDVARSGTFIATKHA